MEAGGYLILPYLSLKMNQWIFIIIYILLWGFEDVFNSQELKDQAVSSHMNLSDQQKKINSHDDIKCSFFVSLFILAGA